MRLYKGFAELYTKGPYKFSEDLISYLPKIFRYYNIQPKNILDLCCGDGRFAVAMAQKNIKVTGVDASPDMLKYAKQRAHRARVRVKFIKQQMQNLVIAEKFDLVTCWFDSMNYLLTKKELDKTFRNIYQVLNRPGFFIFDVNTIYGLSYTWPQTSPGVVQDTEGIFEVHICPPTFKKHIATLRIIGFRKQGRFWQRIQEVHKERGYPLNEIRRSFRKTHFFELGCWESLEIMKKPRRDSGKVFFILKKTW